MSRLLFFLMLFAQCSFAISPAELQTMRKLFYFSTEDADSSSALFNQLEKVNLDSAAILIGYKGMSMLLEAKHSWNVYTKYSYFNKGTALLDQSISKDSTNMELRFFRYTVQDNAPSFLGYNTNLIADKQLLLAGLASETDIDLKNKIKEYFKLN